MKSHLRYLAQAGCLASALALQSCTGSTETFAQRPGFTAHFAQFPPSAETPVNTERELLEQYRPRVFKAQGQQGPVDFYRDYIASGYLAIDGKKVGSSPDQALLNRYRDTPEACFFYTGATRVDAPAVIYGRIDHADLQHAGTTYPLRFLSYDLVFPTSGLLSGLSALQRIALDMVADLDDWHQLDHYVAFTLALYRDRPVAIMLQQHNYQTTYLINQDLPWPADDRIGVDIALRSNELYPHHAERISHAAVSFVTADNVEFLISGNNKPLMAGYDVTHGEIEIDYTLKFLPQTDAFYQFKGRLGEPRLLPGRSGPPGADYVTLPGLMPLTNQLVTAYRPGTVAEERARLAKLFNGKSMQVNREAIALYTAHFVEAALADF